MVDRRSGRSGRGSRSRSGRRRSSVRNRRRQRSNSRQEGSKATGEKRGSGGRKASSKEEKEVKERAKEEDAKSDSSDEDDEEAEEDDDEADADARANANNKKAPVAGAPDAKDAESKGEADAGESDSSDSDDEEDEDNKSAESEKLKESAAPAKSGGAVPRASVPPLGVPSLKVDGCSNKTVRDIVEGNYHPHSQNHGKPVWMKDGLDRGSDFGVLIYFWDSRDGQDVCGWWLGPEVGGDQVWAYHPTVTSGTPPQTGWSLPLEGCVDMGFRVSVVPGTGTEEAEGASVFEIGRNNNVSEESGDVLEMDLAHQEQAKELQAKIAEVQSMKADDHRKLSELTMQLEAKRRQEEDLKNQLEKVLVALKEESRKLEEHKQQVDLRQKNEEELTRQLQALKQDAEERRRKLAEEARLRKEEAESNRKKEAEALAEAEKKRKEEKRQKEEEARKRREQEEAAERQRKEEEEKRQRRREEEEAEQLKKEQEEKRQRRREEEEAEQLNKEQEEQEAEKKRRRKKDDDEEEEPSQRKRDERKEERRDNRKEGRRKEDDRRRKDEDEDDVRGRRNDRHGRHGDARRRDEDDGRGQRREDEDGRSRRRDEDECRSRERRRGEARSGGRRGDDEGRRSKDHRHDEDGRDRRRGEEEKRRRRDEDDESEVEGKKAKKDKERERERDKDRGRNKEKEGNREKDRGRESTKESKDAKDLDADGKSKEARSETMKELTNEEEREEKKQEAKDIMGRQNAATLSTSNLPFPLVDLESPKLSFLEEAAAAKVPEDVRRRRVEMLRQREMEEKAALRQEQAHKDALTLAEAVRLRLAGKSDEASQQYVEAQTALSARVGEQQATMNIVRAIKELSEATPDTFGRLKKELEDTLAKERVHAGSQWDSLKAEADTVLGFIHEDIERQIRHEAQEKMKKQKGMSPLTDAPEANLDVQLPLRQEEEKVQEKQRKQEAPQVLETQVGKESSDHLADAALASDRQTPQEAEKQEVKSPEIQALEMKEDAAEKLPANESSLVQKVTLVAPPAPGSQGDQDMAKKLLEELVALVQEAKDSVESAHRLAEKLSSGGLPVTLLSAAALEAEQVARTALKKCARCADFIAERKPLLDATTVMQAEIHETMSLVQPQVQALTRHVVTIIEHTQAHAQAGLNKPAPLPSNNTSVSKGAMMTVLKPKSAMMVGAASGLSSSPAIAPMAGVHGWSGLSGFAQLAGLAGFAPGHQSTLPAALGRAVVAKAPITVPPPMSTPAAAVSMHAPCAQGGVAMPYQGMGPTTVLPPALGHINVPPPPKPSIVLPSQVALGKWPGMS